jgi:uncharacterized protein (DUF4415 family)
MSVATRIHDEADMPADVSSRIGWRRAGRVLDPGRVKLPSKRITINLDADIVSAFKAEALRGGPPYQVAINQALRQHLREREARARGEGVEAVLDALDDAKVRRKIRGLLPRSASPKLGRQTRRRGRRGGQRRTRG